MNFELFYPVKDPINQSNPFGANPDFYKTLGQDGHPGIDFGSPSGTPLFAPCDGDAFYAQDRLKGDGIWIRWPNNAKPQYNIILWHLYPPSEMKEWKISTTPAVVTQVKAGQLLAYTDNSGFPNESTGPHLHLGVMPCDATGAALNPNNGFDGCVDPHLLFNGEYAEDIQAIEAVVSASEQAVQTITQAPITNQQKSAFLVFLSSILAKLAALFKGRNQTQ